MCTDPLSISGLGVGRSCRDLRSRKAYLGATLIGTSDGCIFVEEVLTTRSHHFFA